MIAVIDSNGNFVSQIHVPTAEDLARPDVVEAPDIDFITNEFRLVDGVWVAPPPVVLDEGGMSTPPRP